MFASKIRFVHEGARGGTCAFTLKIVNTLIKNSSRNDRPPISTWKSTHGQPASCQARPAHVDDGLEDIRWIRGLGGEKLSAASYALLPDLKKVCFLPSERDRDFLSPVSTQQRPFVSCIRRLAGARHVSPAVLLTLCPERGSEPLTSAPRSCLLYTSPSPRDQRGSRMPSSA